MLEVRLLEQDGGLAIAITISQALLWTDAVLTFSILNDVEVDVSIIADFALTDTRSIGVAKTNKPIRVQDEARDGIEGFSRRMRMTIDVLVGSCLPGLGLLIIVDLSVLLLWLESSLEATWLADVLIAFREASDELDRSAVWLECQLPASLHARERTHSSLRAHRCMQGLILHPSASYELPSTIH